MATAEDFIIRMQNQVSPAAEQALRSLAQLEARIKETQRELNAMRARDPNTGKSVSGGGDQAAIAKKMQQLRALRIEAERTKQAIVAASSTGGGGSALGGFKNVEGAVSKIGGAVGGIERAGASLANAGKGATELAGTLRALGGGLRVVDGEAGRVVQSAGKLVRALGKGGTAGAVLLAVVAVLALVGALAYAAFAFAKFGIEASDAARNVQLNVQSLGIAEGQAKALAQTMEDLRKTTGVSVDEQTKLLGELKSAHIKVNDEALRAIAIAQAGGGEEAVKKVVAALKQGESATKALADAQKKWGKLVEEKMLGLDAQMAKFHGDIKDLFAGINIEPFLKALQKLLSLFDSSTVTGRILKQIITAIGQKLVDLATKALPYVVTGFKYILLYAMKAYIAIVQFFRSDLGKGLIVVLKVIGIALAAFMAIWVAAGAMFIAAFFAPMMLVIGLIKLVVWAFGTIVDGVKNAIGALDSLTGGFLSAGWAMIKGLISGVMSGAGAFVNALLGIAKSGISAVKAALGISSPSRIFAQIGANVVTGFAQPMQSGGGGKVADAAGSMAGAAVDGASVKATAKGAKASGAAKIAYIEINGGGASAKDIATEVRVALRGIFEVEELAGDMA